MATLENFGIMLEPQEGLTVDDILDWADYAEKAGYGYVFRSDHLLPTSGRRGPPSPECWVSLGALAARTSRVKFGPMVTPIGFRNPALLARMACTLHSFSRGRLQFGVGAGWYGEEYAAHGYAFPGFRTRRAQFDEALRIMIPLVRGERVDFDGKYFSAHTDCLPRPSGRVNVILGGKSRAVARAAAEFADEMNLFGPTKELVAALEPLLRSRENLQLSSTGPCIVAADRRGLEGRLKKWMARRGVSEEADAYAERLKSAGVLVGTPREFAAELADRMDWGIRKFYFQVNDPADREMFDVLTDVLKAGL